MAKATGKAGNKSTKKLRGTAKQHIKYGGEYFAAGEEFDVDEKDVEELKQYADIKIEETPANDQESDEANSQEEGKGEEEGE